MQGTGQRAAVCTPDLGRERHTELPVRFHQPVSECWSVVGDSQANGGGRGAVGKPCPQCAPWSQESVTMASPWPDCRKPLPVPAGRGGGSTFWWARTSSPLVPAQGGKRWLQGAETTELGWGQRSPRGAPSSPLPPSLLLFPFLLPAVRLNRRLRKHPGLSRHLPCRPLEEGRPGSHAPARMFLCKAPGHPAILLPHPHPSAPSSPWRPSASSHLCPRPGLLGVTVGPHFQP